MSEREELAALVKEIHSRGWAPGTGGNFSLLLSRDPFRLLMTPSGIDKGSTTADLLIEVNEEGNTGGHSAPSAETLLHLAIIGETDAEVVLHTHSVWNTLASSKCDQVALAGYEMLKGLRGVTTHQHVELVPVIENSQDMQSLAQEFRTLLKEHPESHGILLQGHGLYTWGRDLFEARRHLEVLEFLFEVSLRSKGLN